MAVIVKYVCPVHDEVVLFTSRLDLLVYVEPERPKTCPKCKKPYYKSECNELHGGGGNYEDEG